MNPKSAKMNDILTFELIVKLIEFDDEYVQNIHNIRIKHEIILLKYFIKIEIF